MNHSPALMLEMIEREQLRRRAESNLYEFVRQSWHVVEPGIPFIPSWHIEDYQPTFIQLNPLGATR